MSGYHSESDDSDAYERWCNKRGMPRPRRGQGRGQGDDQGSTNKERASQGSESSSEVDNSQSDAHDDGERNDLIPSHGSESEPRSPVESISSAGAWSEEEPNNLAEPALTPSSPASEVGSEPTSPVDSLYDASSEGDPDNLAESAMVLYNPSPEPESESDPAEDSSLNFTTGAVMPYHQDPDTMQLQKIPVTDVTPYWSQLSRSLTWPQHIFLWIVVLVVIPNELGFFDRFFQAGPSNVSVYEIVPTPRYITETKKAKSLGSNAVIRAVNFASVNSIPGDTPKQLQASVKKAVDDLEACLKRDNKLVQKYDKLARQQDRMLYVIFRDVYKLQPEEAMQAWDNRLEIQSGDDDVCLRPSSFSKTVSLFTGKIKRQCGPDEEAGVVLREIYASTQKFHDGFHKNGQCMDTQVAVWEALQEEGQKFQEKMIEQYSKDKFIWKSCCEFLTSAVLGNPKNGILSDNKNAMVPMNTFLAMVSANRKLLTAKTEAWDINRRRTVKLLVDMYPQGATKLSITDEERQEDNSEAWPKDAQYPRLAWELSARCEWSP